MATKIVNIFHNPNYEVYIGRAGRGLDGTFGNPFRIGRDGDRETVLRRFSVYFLERVERNSQFRDLRGPLKGKSLGCFCKPKDGFRGRLLCHGQIIAAWLDGVDDPAKVE